MEEADGPAVVEDVEEPAVVEVIFCTGGGDVWCCMVVAITLTCTTCGTVVCAGVQVFSNFGEQDRARPGRIPKMVLRF